MHADRYPADKMRALVRKLQARGQHWVAIQDAGVAADVGYHAYEAGTQDRVWITDENGTDYLGQVWPGEYQGCTANKKVNFKSS
jgi:alpha-glucosidase